MISIKNHITENILGIFKFNKIIINFLILYILLQTLLVCFVAIALVQAIPAPAEETLVPGDVDFDSFNPADIQEIIKLKKLKKLFGQDSCEQTPLFINTTNDEPKTHLSKLNFCHL